MCVQQKKTIHDEKRLHHRNDAYFVKTPAEMEAYFKHIPEAMENAARIGELCNVEFKLGKTYLPKFQVPDGYDRRDLRAGRSPREGLEEAHRGGPPRAASKVDGDVYAARLALELGVIQKMGFSGYFLIVWDFIRYAKEHGIPVGPGPRLGRRLAGRVLRCASPTSIRIALQAAVRALPEPRARVDAGLRHRLLHEPARRGHQLRHREVRQGQRRPDRRRCTSSRRAA